MSFYTSSLSNLCPRKYVATTDKYEVKWRKDMFPLGLEHTYLIVFSKSQVEHLKQFKALNYVNILYQSVPAFNDVHPNESANTLIIFEFKELPPESDILPVPEVSGSW